MDTTAVAVAVAVAAAALLVRVAHADIKIAPIVSDARPIIFFEEFGFASGGRAAVSIRRATWQLRPGSSRLTSVDSSLMGFVLIAGAQFPGINNQTQYYGADPEGGGRFCLLTSDYALPMLRLSDVPPGGVTTTVTIDYPDAYAVVFSNCQGGVEVTMDVRTEMYNVRRDASGGGIIRDYLPVGLQPLPGIYAGVAAVYLAFLAGWVWTCVRQHATTERIHAVMGALLLFKALKSACAAEDAWFIERTGTSHGWDVAFYVFGFFKGVLLFTVIVLIGTGWSFLKPYLQEREKSVLMIVIPLQVMENLLLVVIGETGPTRRGWIAWTRDRRQGARNLKKLTLFKRFYLVVVGYLYFTRIIVSAFLALLNYRYRWGVDVAVEAASFAFYLFVFYTFKPEEKNPYLYIGDEEEEEEEVDGGHIETDDGAFWALIHGMQSRLLPKSLVRMMYSVRAT
ncbi:unnamed protein product [Miscanthus lutarioriparius]|uniref:Uncharacterized protein n=1 Tax=Miscanthus lutarioriparius TaxID=422564 RepID=A0A811PUR5_9POAL|nr:unnamed protein product [Miscanthus lutarioriparius]